MVSTMNIQEMLVLRGNDLSRTVHEKQNVVGMIVLGIGLKPSPKVKRWKPPVRKVVESEPGF